MSGADILRYHQFYYMHARASHGYSSFPATGLRCPMRLDDDGELAIGGSGLRQGQEHRGTTFWLHYMVMLRTRGMMCQYMHLFFLVRLL